MKYIELYNGVNIPTQVAGTSVWDAKGSWKDNILRMNTAIEYALSLNAVGIDTGRDYHNEVELGKIFSRLIEEGNLKREDLFITTKVGNGQQTGGNMSKELQQSLTSLKLDYLDLWMLHWPFPDFWIDNWKQLIELYKEGKVKAIGIANMRERHIIELEKQGLMMPHVIQIEYHPFRTVPGFIKMCKERNIQVEAYSSNCLMLPFVKENKTLSEIAASHKKSITQIITRWHIQHGVVPIFSSFNPVHIKENVDVYDFELSEDEMRRIFALNIDYKFHPESINCPGY